MSDVYIRVTRPEGYEGVASALVAEDAMTNQPGYWVYSDATNEVENLKAGLDASNALDNLANALKPSAVPDLADDAIADLKAERNAMRPVVDAAVAWYRTRRMGLASSPTIQCLYHCVVAYLASKEEGR